MLHRHQKPKCSFSDSRDPRKRKDKCPNLCIFPHLSKMWGQLTISAGAGYKIVFQNNSHKSLKRFKFLRTKQTIQKKVIRICKHVNICTFAFEIRGFFIDCYISIYRTIRVYFSLLTCSFICCSNDSFVLMLSWGVIWNKLKRVCVFS